MAVYPRRLTTEERDEICSRYLAGEPPAAIGQALGISAQTVTMTLKRRSIPPLFRPRLTDEELLLRNLNRSAPDECWEYQGQLDRAGYGRLRAGPRTGRTRKAIRAHRLAYRLWVGELIPGLVVMHTCDNPPCCNPAHLKQGTSVENTADMVRKGRQAKGDRQGFRMHPEAHARGEDNPSSKMTEQSVREMRRLNREGCAYGALARQFGISAPAAALICKRKTWKHVSD